MQLLFASFFAGVLTVIAPCVLSLLPIILGGSLGQKDKLKPLIIASSLGVSVIIFTLLLKATTAFIEIPQIFWRYLSGFLIIFFAITMIFPDLWTKVSLKLKLYKSENALEKSSKKEGHLGSILLGASLGPVFTTCSPTYTLILAIVLPQNFILGLTYLAAYVFGLMLILLLIGYGGQKFTSLFKPLSKPNGWFKKILGIILLITGISISTGFDKTIEQKILKKGYLGPINIEQNILGSTKPKQ